MVAKQGLMMGVVLSVASTQAFAGEAITTGTFPVEKRNVVTVSVPIQGVGGPQVALEGERVLGERVSVGLGVFTSFRHSRERFGDPAVTDVTGTNTTQWELGLSPALRFYLTGKAPQGLWLSPRLEVGYGRYASQYVNAPPEDPRYRDTHSNGWSVGALAVLGYSVVLDAGFTVQGGLGVGVSRSSRTYDLFMLGAQGQEQVRAKSSAWNLTERLAVNVGWAF
jgi:hypothetical protein